MTRKLRVSPLASPLEVVLVEPEIPQNTGNIARLCAATQCPLHLVGRLGFQIDEKAVRRAGLDYWHLVKLETHPDFRSFELRKPSAKIHVFSATGAKSYLDMDIAPGDALVFGKESAGLPRDLLERFSDRCYGIPTAGAVRSINLASAAAIVVYEALRKCGGLDNAKLEDDPLGSL
ncbi:MAG: tRNA (cytidine(34)-2'-O)-methyltransferase [Deltaproteobacteria bacterium]|nr:tRNA (cytidine(34)-2'-O)-methyltransferase [Deltaproteobacteria bacterium]